MRGFKSHGKDLPMLSNASMHVNQENIALPNVAVDDDVAISVRSLSKCYHVT